MFRVWRFVFATGLVVLVVGLLMCFVSQIAFNRPSRIRLRIGQVDRERSFPAASSKL
jgi:hypothetical protein